ncbi:hypothetical protein ZIOFF_026125 [Zingiber officinale]|uniref:EF-hand domain-containing protein n=1 Tax=Zingiber officinale TaxID=94328 RepID=A0A8J5H2L0_ZINOF|nr:hypothetical protein ZIOFF_026125 [Zingiber officinale]
MDNAVILREWYDRVDSNRSGNITAHQLQRALSVGNLDFSLSVVQQMIRMYDFDGNGTMNFEGGFITLFLVMQCVGCCQDAHGSAGITSFISLTSKKFLALNKFLLKVQNAFTLKERGRGYLNPDDVYEGLVSLGFSLDSPSFLTVCESFDKNKRGMVRLDDFISLCIFVQSARYAYSFARRNLFNSFDTTKQGRITLDFNQFVYCSE